MALLEVQELCKTYQIKTDAKRTSIQALHDVSFQLNKGDRLGVLGSSGCGKTTLLKVIFGLTKPTSGNVIKNATVGFVAQDPYASLCHAMSVCEIIAEPLLYLKKRRSTALCEQEIREVMSWVYLDYDTYASRYPHQLSGGERQRVSIARALISRPEILALDEPTSMVDYEAKAGIANVIRSASEAAGSALLLVTHDIALASDLCDRLLVIQHGKIIENAPTSEILHHSRHEHTKRLVLAGTNLKQYWTEATVEASQ